MPNLMTTCFEGKCLCGKQFCVGYDDESHPCILHELPTCQLFDRYDDPADYLAYLNKALGPN